MAEPLFFLVYLASVWSGPQFSVMRCNLQASLSVAFPQIMLLTDPEIESSLLISSDEGATYQKYRLNFYIQSLLFHPKQEDWILAYSQDQKVSTLAMLDTAVHTCPGKGHWLPIWNYHLTDHFSLFFSSVQ